MLLADRRQKNNEKGQVAIIAIVLVSFMLIMVVLAISFVSVSDYKMADIAGDSVQAFFLAESGMEDAFLRLRRDQLYSGGSYETEVGDYTITVDKSGNDYTVRSEGQYGNVTRVVTATLSIEIQSERITKYAAYGSDDVWMYWSNAAVYGDLWANDDTNFYNDCKVYGNAVSAGRGSFYTSWVNWGAEILDNPNTPDIVEGNLWSVNTIKVWGGHISGDAYSEHGIEILHAGQIDGSMYEYQDLSAETERIEVPIFDYATYETEARNNGTFFATAVQFESYVNGLDDGNTKTMPDGVYYIENGNVEFGPGSRIVLNGTIVTEGRLIFYCGLDVNAQNDLPAIVAQKDIKIQDLGWPIYGGDTVNINGVLYSERDIVLNHNNGAGKIIVNGAAWSGDNLRVEEDTDVIYDPDVVNTEGFGFVTSSDNIELLDWRETI